MFELEKIQKIVGKEQVKQGESLSLHTTFRIGGPADYYVVPKSVEAFVAAVKYCREENVPYFILGNGSNLLVGDKGFRGVIIATAVRGMEGKETNAQEMALDEIGFYSAESLEQSTAERLKEQGYISTIDQDKIYVCAGAGVLLSKLAAAIAKNGLTGFEFASGIPGTLGGAVTMNAGAYGGEIKDCIVSARVLTKENSIKILSAEELKLGYRNSIIQREGSIVLNAVFAFSKGVEEDIFGTMKELNQKRKEKQPLEFGSAGSTFKRPEGHFAGKLIQDAGLKGYRVGDVMVSEKHCGFVVNVGKGTYEQAMEVIHHVQEVVLEKYGVSLEMEIKQLGEE